MKFFGKQLEFYVVNNCTMVHDILLGDDSLRTLRVTMTYNPDTGDWVKIAGRKYYFNKKISMDEEMNSLKLEVDQWASEYPDVFKEEEDDLPATTALKMTIDTGSAHPIICRPYRLPLSKKKFVEEEIDRMLRLKIIEPSMSPWAAPIVLAPKPGGDGQPSTYRFCVDYRKLNEVTVHDGGPLPNIQEIFDGILHSYSKRVPPFGYGGKGSLKYIFCK